VPLDLTAREFETPWFDVLHSGKARSLVTSCHLDKGQLILADASGNVWSIDSGTGKKQWAAKCKYGLKFGLHQINGQLLAFHEKGLARISPENGNLETLLPLRNVHSPVLINNRFYLLDSAQWWISKGNLLEVDPNTLEIKTLYQESTKRCMGNIYTREIAAWTEDRILFFGDGHLRSYHLPSGTISQVLDESYNNLAGLMTVGEHVFLIADFDWERNRSLREHPHFQKVLHFDNAKQVDIVDDEGQFLGSLSYSGSVQYSKENNAIATFAGLVFQVGGKHFQKIGRLIANDLYPRTPCTAQTAQFGGQVLIFFKSSYGEHAEEVGFVMSSVDASNKYSRLEHYICGKLGKNFGSDAIHAFGEYLIVCGDGHYHLLHLK
jgi:hypothetical protein